MVNAIRGGTFRRALQLVELLEEHRYGVTVHQVAERLEVTTRTAYRWLSAAEDELPLVRCRGAGGSAAVPGRWTLLKYLGEQE